MAEQNKNKQQGQQEQGRQQQQGQQGQQQGSWAQQNKGGARIININEASVQDLEQVEGIGPKRAQDIIQYREEHGGFQSVDELNQIPGFAGRLTEDVKQRLAA